MTEIPEICFADMTWRLPFANLFRPHTAEERAALASEVAELGVLQRVVVYDSPKWGKRCVIDGACRLEISLAQGKSAIPTHSRGPLDDARAEREAISLNMARRHLEPAELAVYRERRNKDIVADRIAGDSLQVIADRFGIHLTMVQKILLAAEEAGTLDRSKVPAMVTGVDGIQRPSSGSRSVDPQRRIANRLVDVVGELLQGTFAPRLHTICRRHQLDEQGEATVRAVLADLAAEAAQPREV